MGNPIARQSLAFLRRQPGITAIAILILGLAIAANTVVFGVIDAMLLDPLPYPESDNLVVPVIVNLERGTRSQSVAWVDFDDWHRQRDIFEQVAIFYTRSYDLSQGEEPMRVAGALVSADFFPLNRARPVLGRLLEPADYAADAEAVVVLGQGLWHDRFGSREDILGETLRLSDVPFTVVGVVDSGTTVLSAPDVWRPLSFGQPLPEWVTDPDNYFLGSVLRLRAGVGMDQAQARVRALSERVAQALPAERGSIRIELETLKQRLVGGEPRQIVVLVFASVFLVLLIACFNVANLLMARALDRRREMALCMALGAGRSHILRQLLAEGTILAAAGGALGVTLAWWATGLIRARAAAGFGGPGLALIELEPSVLAFAIGLCSLTALCFGLLPAWQLTRTRLSGLLRGGRLPGADLNQARRLRAGLVVAEIAISVVLLATAGGMIRSLLHVSRRPCGVELGSRLTLSVQPPSSRYPGRVERNAFFDRLLGRLQALPGATRVAASSVLPLSGGGVYLSRVHLVEGHPRPPDGPEHRAMWNVITPEYFAAMGIALLGGRVFSAADGGDGPPVVIINRTLAERMFPGQDPIGQRIRSWRDEDLLREIVGVVDSVRFRGLGDELEPMVYVPYGQVDWPSPGKVVIRTAADPVLLAGLAREVVCDLDPSLPVTEVLSLEEIAAGSVDRERTLSMTLAGFASVAMVLAALGLYGVISYTVAMRRQEIGVRMAVGARAASVIWRVLSQGLVYAVAGAGLGTIVMVVFGDLLAPFLVETSPTDPLSAVAVLVALLGFTCVATLVPALRAARLDPLTVLRGE